MNYIAEIKAFYERLELNPQTDAVIALWNALMNIANKAGWPDTFTAAQSYLMLKSGTSASVFKRARNKLAKDGFIRWKSRGGNLSAQYEMISLVVQYEPQNEPHIEPQIEPQNRQHNKPQTGPINKQKQKLNKNIMCKADASALFEQLWKIYPVKKGKGQVSDTQKKRLFEIGVDEMSRAIDRYLAELKKDSWRHPQNGSTFFNSGYVDYLDANYMPGQKDRKITGENQFNNFQQQNNYDFAQLEAELMSN